METFAKRLSYLLDLKGIKNPNEFGKTLGYSNSEKIIRLFRDPNNKPSYEILEDITNKFEDINANWLLTGRGNMLRGDIVTPTNFNSQGSMKLQTTIKPKHKALPLIPVEAMAGYAAGDVSYGDTDMTYYVVPEFEDADFFIRLRGDSMRPRYNHGDVVACKFVREPQFLQWGKIYVLDTEQGAVIKKLVAGDAPDEITAISTNPEYPPFTIKKEHVRAFAVVLGAICFE